MQPGLWQGRKRLTEGARSVSEPTSGGTELSERRSVPVGTAVARSPDRTPWPGAGSIATRQRSRRRARLRSDTCCDAYVLGQCHPRPLRRLLAARDVTVTMSEHRTLAVRMSDAMAMRVASLGTSETSASSPRKRMRNHAAGWPTAPLTWWITCGRRPHSTANGRCRSHAGSGSGLDAGRHLATR